MTSIDDIDETPPQRAAAIELSDPQIYSRETMLNDRRREADYLDKLIKDSANVTFEPQMKRVLQSVQALQGNLDVSVSPQLAADNQRSQQLANAQQQIDLSQKQTALYLQQAQEAQAKNQLTAAQAAVPPAQVTPAAPAADLTTVNSQIKSLQDTATAQQTSIDALKSQVAAAGPADISGRLPKIVPAQSASITASPLELYRDRQAYRDELRAAQSQAQLDDGHDLDGHGLYRLQFNATVLPGTVKNKFAVARLTVQPTPPFGAKTTQLYKLWLAHAAYRLNGIGIDAGDGGPISTDSLFLTLASEQKLLSYVEYRVSEPNSPGNRVHKIMIAVPPKLQSYVQRFVDGDSNNARNVSSDLSAFIKNLFSLVPKGNISSQNQPSSPSQQPNQPQPATSANSVAPDSKDAPSAAECAENPQFASGIALTFLAASLRGMGDWQLLTVDQRGKIEDLLDKIRKSEIPAAPATPPTHSNSDTHKSCDVVESVFVPDIFRHLVEGTEDKDLLEGIEDKDLLHSYAYATAPIELVQRVSTVASALESLQFGLSLAGSTAASGLGAKGTLNYLEAAQGQVEALERLPLVAGFSDRTKCADVKNIPDMKDGPDLRGVSCAQFGWIFGPHATLNPEKKRLELAQGVHNYPVTVDLAVPSWWPSIELKLETAWVSNWGESDELLHNSAIRWNDPKGKADALGENVIIRSLPHNRADLDGLTEALAYRTMGGALATSRIYRAEPQSVSACNDNVSILVYGANIWRSTEAYLNGARAKEVSVLPDMAGLALSFDPSALPKVKQSTLVNLVVWTRNGPSEHKINLTPGECASTASVGASLHWPTPRLTGADLTTTVTVAGGLSGLPAALKVRLKDVKNAVWFSVPVTTDAAGDGKNYKLTFAGKLSDLAPFKNFPTGAQLLESTLQMAAPGNSEGSILTFDGPFVYYPTAPALTAKLDNSGSTTMTSLSDKLVIGLPPFAEQGFVGFNPATVTFSAKADGLAEPLTVTPAGSKGGAPTITLAPPAGKTEADLRKADVKITISAQGSDVPQPCASCLALPKSP